MEVNGVWALQSPAEPLPYFTRCAEMTQGALQGGKCTKDEMITTKPGSSGDRFSP